MSRAHNNQSVSTLSVSRTWNSADRTLEHYNYMLVSSTVFVSIQLVRSAIDLQFIDTASDWAVMPITWFLVYLSDEIWA